MSVLKNRKIAVLVAVVVIVVATFFGVNASVSRLTGDIERLFFDGVYIESEGYMQPSINSQIAKQADAALNLATLLQIYPGWESASEAGLNARRVLLDAEGISEKSRAQHEMEQALVILVEATYRSTELGEREIDAVAQHWKSYQGASGYIEGTLAPDYNNKVDEFYNQLSIIAALITGIAPEYYR